MAKEAIVCDLDILHIVVDKGEIQILLALEC